MSILNLLKEKTADEKQNFLNSIRSKASSKLKNTDDNKILDVISIVDAFILFVMFLIIKKNLMKL